MGRYAKAHVHKLHGTHVKGKEHHGMNHHAHGVNKENGGDPFGTGTGSWMTGVAYQKENDAAAVGARVSAAFGRTVAANAQAPGAPYGPSSVGEHVKAKRKALSAGAAKRGNGGAGGARSPPGNAAKFRVFSDHPGDKDKSPGSSGGKGTSKTARRKSRPMSASPYAASPAGAGGISVGSHQGDAAHSATFSGTATRSLREKVEAYREQVSAYEERVTAYEEKVTVMRQEREALELENAAKDDELVALRKRVESLEAVVVHSSSRDAVEGAHDGEVRIVSPDWSPPHHAPAPALVDDSPPMPSIFDRIQISDDEEEEEEEDVGPDDDSETERDVSVGVGVGAKMSSTFPGGGEGGAAAAELTATGKSAAVEMAAAMAAAAGAARYGVGGGLEDDVGEEHEGAEASSDLLADELRMLTAESEGLDAFGISDEEGEEEEKRHREVAGDTAASNSFDAETAPAPPPSPPPPSEEVGGFAAFKKRQQAKLSSPRAPVSSPPKRLMPCGGCRAVVQLSAENEQLRAKCEQLEAAVEECTRGAQQYAARYAFMVLDEDRDGLVGVEELLRMELFASYAQTVVERIHAHFDYTSGVHGQFNVEDFCRLSAMTEDRHSKQAQAFWFRIADVDGDGVLGIHDIKWLYDQIWKDEGSCISLEDLVCQVYDMAGKPPPWRSGATGRGRDGGYNPYGFGRGVGAPGGADGIRLSEIRRSKLGSGIFGILVNHNDMLLRRSTAEFSKSDVPM